MIAVTGLYATGVILGAGHFAQPERDHEPERAEIREPSCRFLVLLNVVAWRRFALYPRPDGLRTVGN